MKLVFVRSNSFNEKCKPHCWANWPVVQRRRAETDDLLLSCWLVNEARLGCKVSEGHLHLQRQRSHQAASVISSILQTSNNIHLQPSALAPHVAWVNTKSTLCGYTKPTKSRPRKSWGKLLEMASNAEAGAKNVEECCCSWQVNLTRWDLAG